MDNNYNSSYSQQPIEAAPKGLCLAAMIAGIAGFVTGPGVSIAAIIIANLCKNKNGGVHNKKTSIGFKCGVGSLIMWGVGILIYILYIAVIAALLAGSAASNM